MEESDSEQQALPSVTDEQYDLSALWDEHCENEFISRNVHATMATMVPEPYVNHIPTMTGGVVEKDLYRFYEHHFIHNNPPIPISRTVGKDRVVDEMICCFTHDREIDWMLPGIAPTGAYVKILLVAIFSFHDGKLYNEHIYWDRFVNWLVDQFMSVEMHLKNDFKEKRD